MTIAKSLRSYIRGLEHEGISFWWDQRLNAGDLWDSEIKAQLTSADVVLVLVSQAFLNSEGMYATWILCVSRGEEEARIEDHSRHPVGMRLGRP